MDIDEWSKPSRTKRIVQLFIVAIIFASIFWFVPWIPDLNDGSVTVTRWDRRQGEIRAKVGPREKGWVPINQVSKHVLNAIVASEDTRFYTHSGFDFEQIWLSMKINYKKKRFFRGGSTISQQVVKMAFLSREKSMIRKLREAAGTVWLEIMLPKKKILEWYINLAEFGDGVYGAREAASHYFQTKPELLTIEQGVHLALVLPSPNAWSAGLRKRALTPFGHRRYLQIVTNMRLSGFITETLWESSLARGDFGRPVQGYLEMRLGKLSEDAVLDPDFADERPIGAERDLSDTPKKITPQVTQSTSETTPPTESPEADSSQTSFNTPEEKPLNMAPSSMPDPQSQQ